LATPYIDTENTYTENTLLPPLTPPSAKFVKKEEEEEILKKMINFWNEHVQAKLHSSSSPVQLTQSRQQQLCKLLKEMLNNDPAQWEAYCLKISQYRYLMGENASGFKITLDWALKPENALKVLEGAIYDKPQEQTAKELSWTDYVAQIKQHCTQHHYSDDWFEICKRLARMLGQPTFESWLKQLTRSREQVCL
jgi:hypothetical protein